MCLPTRLPKACRASKRWVPSTLREASRNASIMSMGAPRVLVDDRSSWLECSRGPVPSRRPPGDAVEESVQIGGGDGLRVGGPLGFEGAQLAAQRDGVLVLREPDAALVGFLLVQAQVEVEVLVEAARQLAAHAREALRIVAREGFEDALRARRARLLRFEDQNGIAVAAFDLRLVERELARVVARRDAQREAHFLGVLRRVGEGPQRDVVEGGHKPGMGHGGLALTVTPGKGRTKRKRRGGRAEARPGGASPRLLALLALVAVRADGGANLLGALALRAQAAALLARGGLAAEHAVRVAGVADPRDLRVRLDHGVRGVHEDDLVVLVAAVLADPVRVEDLHVGVLLLDALLRDALDALGGGDLADTHAGGLRAHLEARLAQAAAAHAG